jgi:hypothetical protein
MIRAALEERMEQVGLSLHPNTTDLSHAGSRDAVTWDFALVWRRRGTPGRRLGV